MLQQHGAPNWCSSNTDSGQDDYGCSVHFDIQTGPPSNGGNGPDAEGHDGQEWTCELVFCCVLVYVPCYLVTWLVVMWEGKFADDINVVCRWWRVRAV